MYHQFDTQINLYKKNTLHDTVISFVKQNFDEETLTKYHFEEIYETILKSNLDNNSKEYIVSVTNYIKKVLDELKRLLKELHIEYMINDDKLFMLIVIIAVEPVNFINFLSDEFKQTSQLKFKISEERILLPSLQMIILSYVLFDYILDSNQIQDNNKKIYIRFMKDLFDNVKTDNIHQIITKYSLDDIMRAELFIFYLLYSNYPYTTYSYLYESVQDIFLNELHTSSLQQDKKTNFDLIYKCTYDKGAICLKTFYQCNIPDINLKELYKENPIIDQLINLQGWFGQSMDDIDDVLIDLKENNNTPFTVTYTTGCISREIIRTFNILQNIYYTLEVKLKKNADQYLIKFDLYFLFVILKLNYEIDESIYDKFSQIYPETCVFLKKIIDHYGDKLN